MTPPPTGFRTHDCSRRDITSLAQFAQSGSRRSRPIRRSCGISGSATYGITLPR